MDSLQYPVGRFHFEGPSSEKQRRLWIDEIAHTPGKFRSAVAGLPDNQLDTPYRPGGWTVRQVVHHVADSHINSYVRFRLALTETEPTIRPYEQERWAELEDARHAPVEESLILIEALHGRWTRLLRSLNDEAWKRTFRHPDLGIMGLEKNLALYAWHGRHHVAHITALRQRLGW